MLLKQRVMRLVIEQKIFFRTRKKEIVIRYSWATMRENMEFMACKNEEEVIRFFIWWLEKKRGKLFSRKENLSIAPSIQQIIQQLLDTAFKVHRVEFPRSEEENIDVPYSSTVVFLSKQLWLKPRELLEYTIQEIAYLSEGIEWNMNAKTEEGQKNNRLYAQKLSGKWVIEKKKKEIEKFLQT